VILRYINKNEFTCCTWREKIQYCPFQQHVEMIGLISTALHHVSYRMLCLGSTHLDVQRVFLTRNIDENPG